MAAKSKGKAKVGERSSFTFDHGSLAEKDMILTIVLTSQHVDEPSPKLFISAESAFLLTNCLEILDDPPGRFTGDLSMTDMSKNQYHMTISNEFEEFPGRFLVNTDWSKFVHHNKLKEGDKLGFYRLFDTDSRQTWYVVRPFKKAGNLEPSSFSDGNQSRRILPRSVPSFVPRDDMEPTNPQNRLPVLTKTLTARSTNPIDPVLFITTHDAYTLTGMFEMVIPSMINSRLPMELPVFEGNSVYIMMLSFSAREYQYTISQEWGKFVRMHKLTAGDQIRFYRYPTSDGLGSSYKIEIVRREESKIITQPLKHNDLNRSISVPSTKLTKKLSVDQGNILKICFDGHEAWDLTSCPRVLEDPRGGTNLMKLLVYDEIDNTRYDMALTSLKSNNGEVIFTLDDDGWLKYVDSHNLKAGDKVSIGRIKGETNYTIGYTRAAIAGASGVGFKRKWQ